ncbi:hypothetical protein L3i20_v234800 [Paenibacillus sp. L3-i20]|nr:hypothetical protein L3i20_v234800 [Paenibacillus sp. L3-i20]
MTRTFIMEFQNLKELMHNVNTDKTVVVVGSGRLTCGSYIKFITLLHKTRILYICIQIDSMPSNY